MVDDYNFAVVLYLHMLMGNRLSLMLLTPKSIRPVKLLSDEVLAWLFV